MAASTQTGLSIPDVPGVTLVFSQDQGGQLWVSVMDRMGTTAYPVSKAQMLQIAAAATAAANA